jgi:hypothetical protein
VTPEIDLGKPIVAEKDALILSLLPLVGRLQAALARIANLRSGSSNSNVRPRRRTISGCRRRRGNSL